MLAVLGPLLSLLGIEAASMTTNLKRHAIVWGLIGAFGVVFVTFLLVAANTALSYAVGPVIAPLIIAVAAVLVALAVFLVASIQDGIEARREAERRRSAETTAMVTTAIVTALPIVLRSPLMREIGVPAGAAILSAMLLRKAVPRGQDPEPH